MSVQDNLEQMMPTWVMYEAHKLSVDQRIAINAVGRVRTLEFDAIFSENYKFSSEATQIPVDSLGVITDHVIQKPEKLSMKVFVTDYGFDYGAVMAAFKTMSADDLKSNHNTFAMFKELENLKNWATPLSIYTNYKTYENMLLTSVSTSVGVDDSSSLSFDLTFQEMLITEFEVVETNVVVLQRPESTKLSAAMKKKIGKKSGGVAMVPSSMQQALNDMQRQNDVFLKKLGASHLRGGFNHLSLIP